MKDDTYVPRFGTLAGTLFIAGVLLALCLGVVFAAPAQGAELAQAPVEGNITGTATVNGQGVAGITVELRQRTNGGGDKTLGSTTTDATGTYNFANQPSAPNDAFYYLRFTGGTNTLAAWFTFPIIYINGSEVTVPSVELADVQLAAPGQDVTLPLPGKLEWKARKMGETYRLFIYSAGSADKPVVDSGSLGTGTEFSLAEGGLAAGKYEAIVQVRDAVAGYGQSAARFRFSVGAASQGGVGIEQGTAAQPPAPSQAAPDVSGVNPAPGAQPPAAPQGSEQEQGAEEESGGPEATAAAQPDLRVSLSADKISLARGDSLVYKLEVENAGSAAAAGVVLTDKLPAGVSVDSGAIKSSAGDVAVDGATVTVRLGEVASGAKATVEIPVKVADSAGSNISNQASLAHSGASEAVLSNAYIAQVAAPLTGPSAPQPQSQPQSSAPQQPAQAQPQAPASGQAAAPQGGKSQAPQAPAAQPPASQRRSSAAASGSAPAAGGAQSPAKAGNKANAPVPKTGGSFPVALAVVLLLVTLLARYLRGLTYRRA